MAVAAKDKQKILNEAKAVHAAALAAIKAAASMLGDYLDGNAKIDASRKKVIKFIKANRGKTAKINAMAKKHNALAASIQKAYDAKKARVDSQCAAAAKKVNAFVKKHKSALKSGPKFKQIADKLQWAQNTFKLMDKARKK